MLYLINSKMDKKQIFKNLLHNGKTREEIIKVMDISKATYYRYLKEYVSSDCIRSTPKENKISLKQYVRYIRENKTGYPGRCSKRALSESYFKSHINTLINFENTNADFIKTIVRGLYIDGESTKDIAELTHISERKIKEYTQGITSIDQIKEHLLCVIEIYKQISQYNGSYIKEVSRIQRALQIVSR